MGQFLEPAFEVNHGLPEGFAATTAVSVIIEVEVPTNQPLVFGVVDSSLNHDGLHAGAFERRGIRVRRVEGSRKDDKRHFWRR